MNVLKNLHTIDCYNYLTKNHQSPIYGLSYDLYGNERLIIIYTHESRLINYIHQNIQYLFYSCLQYFGLVTTDSAKIQQCITKVHDTALSFTPSLKKQKESLEKITQQFQLIETKYNEAKELFNKSEEIKNNLTILEQQKADLELKIAPLNQINNSLEEKLTTLQQKLTEVQTQLHNQDYKKRVETLEQDKKKLENDRDTLWENITELTRQLHHKDHEITKLKQQHRPLLLTLISSLFFYEI